MMLGRWQLNPVPIRVRLRLRLRLKIGLGSQQGFNVERNDYHEDLTDTVRVRF